MEQYNVTGMSCAACSSQGGKSSVPKFLVSHPVQSAC